MAAFFCIFVKYQGDKEWVQCVVKRPMMKFIYSLMTFACVFVLGNPFYEQLKQRKSR